MWGYLMIAPVVIGLAVFYIYPFFDTLVNSFKTIGAFNVSKWCGLANYKKLTTDESLWHTLYNTFRYGNLYRPGDDYSFPSAGGAPEYEKPEGTRHLPCHLFPAVRYDGNCDRSSVEVDV